MTVQEEHLPIGWALAPLGTVVNIVRGVTFPASEKLPGPSHDSVVCLRTSNVQKELDWDDVLHIPNHLVKKDSQWLQSGDTVISMANSYELVGKVAFAQHVPTKATFGGFIAALRAKGLEPQYLYHLLRSAEIQGRLRATASQTVNIANLSIRGMETIDLPIAPQNEQRRIVAKIEELTSRSHRAREALEAVPALLDRFRQSVLAAAFRGDLTAEWRAKNPDVEPASVLLERVRLERRQKWEAELRAKGKDLRKASYPEPETVEPDGLQELPDGWCWASVDELSILTQYGSSAKTNDDPSGTPVMRMGNIVEGSLVFDRLKYLPVDHEEFPDLFLEVGDILFNRTNSPELVGKTAVFEGAGGPVSFASYLIRVRIMGCLPQIVSMYINSPFGRAWVAANVSQQVGQANLNGTKLRALAVPVPPLAEQQKILALVEGALATRGRVQEIAASTRDYIENLNHAILAKAFQGKLVPQDPNDEPASVLLERIKAEQAEVVVPKAKRGRKPRVVAEV